MTLRTGRLVAVDLPAARAAVAALLVALGHDPEDPRLARTPERVAAFAARACAVRAEPAAVPDSARFPAPGPGPLVLAAIPFRSVCEHHLLPFAGTASIVVVPARWAVGLGHLTRLVADAAARLTLQERLAEEVADALVAALDPQGVLVRFTASHGCLWAQGDGAPTTAFTVVAARGIHRDPAVAAATAAMLGPEPGAAG